MKTERGKKNITEVSVPVELLCPVNTDHTQQEVVGWFRKASRSSNTGHLLTCPSTLTAVSPSNHFSVSVRERLYYVSTLIGSSSKLRDGISGEKSSPKSQWMHCLFIEAMRELIPLRSARPCFDKTYPRSQAKHQSSRQELYQINTRQPLFHRLCYCSVLHVYALISVDNVVQFRSQIRSFHCHITM